MKKSDASVVNIASRDISEYLKPKRKSEREFYKNNKWGFTVGSDYSTLLWSLGWNDGFTKGDSMYESYIVGISHVNTKETRRLNKELGLDVINMKH